MPLAVIFEPSKRKDLKSCPPDGFVVIRRMNWGESLKRKDMMASIAMDMQSQKGAKGRNQEETTRIQMDILSEKTTIWEFANLIEEHNLTKMVNSKTGQPCKPTDPDAKEVPLDFKKPEDIKMIEGRIGDEIQLYINELNSFEDSEEVKN
jgi:hypothetical protein